VDPGTGVGGRLWVVRDAGPPPGRAGRAGSLGVSHRARNRSGEHGQCDGLPGARVTNYVKCFGDTFHFYPYANDADVLAQQGKPGAYDDWTLSVEAEVVDLILNSALSVDVQFEGHDVIADNTEYKIWEEQYTLDVQFRNGGQGTYEGVARLEIRIDPSQADQWFITRWQDFLRPGQPDSVQTWGWLRGQERQI